ncbi:MAG: PrgI family protein [Candidatus Saccharibacteria bacterium]|nr:PrgI family protein [Candidatus Saccharibacteria bacterium]
MAQYKVIQDIEAEDKFLGPLTLKQFIFAGIAVLSMYFCFLLLTKGIWVMVFPFIPVIIVSGFLAFPWGKDQTTEVWLLAKIRFYFKPRKRIWNQSGLQELVKITAPVKIEQQLSDNLSQTEVKSRLKALAETIDSRGWAVKNSDYATALQSMDTQHISDRLVEASQLPQTVSPFEEQASDDIFGDARANQIQSQLQQTSDRHKTNAVDHMKDVMNQNATSGLNTEDAPADFWFMNEPAPATNGMATFGTQMSQPVAQDPVLSSRFSSQPVAVDPDDTAILNELHSKNDRSKQVFRNHRSVQPEGANPRPQSVTAAPDPATIELARNNDRVVSSLARESNQIHRSGEDSEVVISLH